VLAILAHTAGASAQATKPNAGTESPKPISPKKRALIRELYVLTRVDEMAEKSANLLLDKLADQLPILLGQALGDAPALRDKDPEEVERLVTQSSIHALSRIKELLPQRVNLAQVMEEIFYPLFDKHFTEDDLTQLAAFYKTPVGQKSIQVLPELTAESIQRTSELINPRLMKLIDEVIQEERDRLVKK